MKTLLPVKDVAGTIVSGELHDTSCVIACVVQALEPSSKSLGAVTARNIWKDGTLSREAGSGHFTKEEREAAIEHVLSQLCSGRSVRSILFQDRANPDLPRLPNIATWWRWVSEDSALEEHLARVRETGIEALLDEVIDIADSLEEDPASRRVRIHARIRLAQMLKPRKYSPRVSLTADEGAPNIAELMEAARKRAGLSG